MSRHKNLGEALIVLAILSLLVGASLFIRPNIGNIMFSSQSYSGTIGSSPLSTTATDGEMDVRFTIRLRPYQTTSFRIVPDNCITAVRINKTDAPDMCTLGKSVTVDWAPYLTTGTNVVFMKVTDTLGKAGVYSGFSISPTGWKVYILHMLFLLVVFGYLIVLFSDLVGKKRWLLTVIFFAGVLLRVGYVSVTPYGIRGYDTAEHFRYITYVSTHWTIPHAAHGWEYHQAPLYYYVMAVPLAVSKLVGIDTDTAKTWMQEASLLFSVITFAIGIWIAILLFRKEKTGWGAALFSLIIASSPVLLYASNRISNDGLYFLVAFLFLALLLRWWESGKENDFILTAVIIGIGFLTRANAYVFLPLLLLCCAARTDMPWRTRIRLMLLAVSCVTIIAGWLIALRFFQKDFSRLFMTHDGNGALTHLQNSLRAFFTFDPLRIANSVYPDIWSDRGSRQFFWEHAYQSAFFGWWTFPPAFRALSTWMLYSGFGVLTLAMFGLLPLQQRKNFFVPVVLSLFVFLGTFAYYRYLHACACNQDVRYIPLAVPLIGYLAVLATEELHPRFRWIFRIWLLWFVTLCFTFFVRLWLG